jgi:hypothetical protein
MRCRLTLHAQYSAGWEYPGSRCRDEILTISFAEQPGPERIRSISTGCNWRFRRWDDDGTLGPCLWNFHVNAAG